MKIILKNIIIAGVLSCSFSYVVSAQTNYEITDLGPDYSALSVNDFGVSVGTIWDGSNRRAVTFNLDGEEIIRLSSLPGLPNSIARDINNSGQFVGDRLLKLMGDEEVFIADLSSAPVEELGAFDGQYAQAWGINERGDISGVIRLSSVDVNRNAFTRTADGVELIYDTLGGSSSQALDINDNGFITGASHNSAVNLDDFVAFIGTPDGEMRSLDVLGQNPNLRAISVGNAINNQNWVAGYSTVFDSSLIIKDVFHAFMGNENDLFDLGALNADKYSYAEDINNSNQVVGYSATSPQGIFTAFYKGSGSDMVQLDELVVDMQGWTKLNIARAISDTGYIVGSGERSNGEFHSFILTPTDLLSTPTPSPSPTITATPVATPTPVPSIEVVIDNDSESSGPSSLWIPIDYEILFFIPGPGALWQLESALPERYGNDYYRLSALDNTGSSEFSWSFTVPEAGNYVVDAWWPQDDSATTVANYVIHSVSGETLVSVQQNSNSGQWNDLGNFNFSAGQTYQITLSAPSGEPVLADSIRVRK